MAFSPKQLEFFANANHRWNVKSGATRSGKTYMDYYLIPKRIRARIGLDGLVFILGVSKGTISRNIIEPLQAIWGKELVSDINSNNIAFLFGQKVFCLGAEKINQISKLRGASVKYCYCDEVVDYSEEVFNMLKSRLDKPYSCSDLACNPDSNTHWFKKFLENKENDIYLQEYTLFDNPFLSKDFVMNLCNEYKGTIFYDRYILGKWKRAEGSIYNKFADNPSGFVCEIVDKIEQQNSVKQILRSSIGEICIGVDFGGNKSGHAFVATAKTRAYKELIALDSERHFDEKGNLDSNELDRLVVAFVKKIIDKYGKVDYVYWDNAETVLGKTITKAINRSFPDVIVRAAYKARIKDRIDCTVRLMGSNRFFITEDILKDNNKNGTLRDALCDAIWDNKKQDDSRLDDGATNIDSLDAFEYTFERDIKRYINK